VTFRRPSFFFFFSLGVRLGEYNIMTPKDCDPYGHNCEPPVQDLLIEKIITHKSYDPSTFINDIALIKLATKANYSYGKLPGESGARWINWINQGW
jgi:hypothetical protein